MAKTAPSRYVLHGYVKNFGHLVHVILFRAFTINWCLFGSSLHLFVFHWYRTQPLLQAQLDFSSPPLMRLDNAFTLQEQRFLYQDLLL